LLENNDTGFSSVSSGRLERKAKKVTVGSPYPWVLDPGFNQLQIKTILARARHWWLTPVILATQEAEIRRIEVRSQPRQIVQEILSQKKPLAKKGLVEWLKV
jgi:hypothetical protein